MVWVAETVPSMTISALAGTSIGWVFALTTELVCAKQARELRFAESFWNGCDCAHDGRWVAANCDGDWHVFANAFPTAEMSCATAIFQPAHNCFGQVLLAASGRRPNCRL